MSLKSTFKSIKPTIISDEKKVDKLVAAMNKRKRKPIHFFMDEDLFTAMRIKIATEGTTMQDYISGLIQKDLGV